MASRGTYREHNWCWCLLLPSRSPFFLFFSNFFSYKKELEGGNVKFRPDSSPSPTYAEWSKVITSSEASVKEGAALVFANFIPHRFRKITNNDSTPHRRTFINFFIVDPTKPLKSTQTIPA